MKYISVALFIAAHLFPAIPSLHAATKIRDYQYFAYGDTMRAVQEDRFKLIVSVCESETNFQLFDLKDDPNEIRNLVDNPQYLDNLELLLAELPKLKRAYQEDDAEAPEFWSNYKPTH
jgi:arylsulfatase A-like enzyme